ncbi:unnamed protein product [Linum tenue]|uniref:Uncharacterized protein n=1 Tax=Linum tenue TaxID=586396 RepID=A0AAV0IVW1_9ROSI|nr:unnamed protein product [Linum tenue]
MDRLSDVFLTLVLDVDDNQQRDDALLLRKKVADEMQDQQEMQERQIPSTTKVQVFINIHREMGWAPCCDQTNVKKGPMPPEEHAKQKEHMGYASDLFYLLKSSLRESTVAGQLRGP